MADCDEIDFDTLDYRAWTLDQRSAFKACVLKSAHAARSECLKSAFCLLVFALQRISILGRASMARPYCAAAQANGNCRTSRVRRAHAKGYRDHTL
jgi:hypothetical protein